MKQTNKAHWGVAQNGLKRLPYLMGMALMGLSVNMAHAQTTPAPAAQAEPQGLQEIVVTAQRRSENLQRAALAVTALNGDQIAERNVTSAGDLNKLVPAVTFAVGGGGSVQVNLRGIGALAGNALAETVVPFNLDGVYLARSQGSNGLFYDLDRVEVLKGPQGTLYGRNATAGAVNIITRKPTHDFGGYISVEAGNYSLKKGEGAVNVPLSDTVQLRIAGQSIDRDGYFTDGYNDEKQYSGRATLRIEPSDNFSILLSADTNHAGGKGQAHVLAGPFVDPSNPYLGPSSPQTTAYYNNPATAPHNFAPFLLPTSPAIVQGQSAPTPNGYNHADVNGVSGTFDWNVGDGKLTLVSSWRQSDYRYSGYSAGFRLDNDESTTAKSLELRYATPDKNRLRGVFGAYYFKDSGHFDLSTYFLDLPGTGIPLAALADPASINLDTRALAGFGQATYDITSTLRLIAGARYSQEKKSVDGMMHQPVASPVTGDLKFNKATWKVGVEADVAPRSLAYFTVGTGFKAGGFYTSPVPNSFKPEFLTAWTLGSKNRFLDNRLQLNAEVFYWDYKDKQVNHLGPVQPSGYSLITENAGKATLYGAEVETRYLLTPDDIVSATVQYEHTRYGSYAVNVTNGVPGNPPTNCKVTPPTPFIPPFVYGVDCSGNELAFAPKWILNLGYSHTFPMASGATVVFSASAIIKSAYWVGEEHLNGQRQSGYGKGDLNLTYNSPNDRWSVGAFVNNVGDRAVSPFSFVTPILQQPVVALEPPRTYGVRAEFKF